MVGVQVGTGRGGQAVPVFAQPVLALLLAGRAAEVGRGAAHVVDVPLEAGVFRQGGDFTDDALVAAGGDHPALVKGQRAEFTGPEAAPVVGDGEADLFDGGHAAHTVVDRVRLPHVGQLGHVVQLRRGQGHGGGIGDEIAVPVGLDDGPAPDGVVLIVLHQIGLGVGFFALADGLIGGDGERGVVAGRGVLGQEAGALHVGDLAHRRSGGQGLGDVGHGPLAHAVDEQVGLGVQQDRAADLILPVVVMGEAAEGGL